MSPTNWLSHVCRRAWRDLEAARVALTLVMSVAAGPVLSAQTAPAAGPHLEAILTPGMTVWITDPVGREERMRIVDVSREILTIRVGDDTRRLRTADVRRVRVRRQDSLVNGALIGAGAAVASGLFLCNLTEPWENCRDDVGPIVRIGAIGAGVGIGIDALIRGRRTIYEGGAAIGAAARSANRRRSCERVAGFAQFLNGRTTSL